MSITARSLVQLKDGYVDRESYGVKVGDIGTVIRVLPPVADVDFPTVVAAKTVGHDFTVPMPTIFLEEVD